MNHGVKLETLSRVEAERQFPLAPLVFIAFDGACTGLPLIDFEFPCLDAAPADLSAGLLPQDCFTPADGRENLLTPGAAA